MSETLRLPEVYRNFVLNALHAEKLHFSQIVARVARVMHEHPQKVDRRVDRALQSLRKAGKVAFDRKDGWSLVQP